MTKRATQYADDLESADPKDIILVNKRGDVVSRRGRRLRWGLYYGLLGTLLSIEAFLGYALWGAPGLGIAGALGLLLGWRVLLNARYGDAVRAAVALDIAEAEKAFEAILARRFLPVGFRAITTAWLGHCAMMQGEPELALERTREALRRAGRRANTVQMKLARLREVHCLVRLGRLDEARQRFEALGGEPKGEVFRLGYYTAELHLAFAEGRCSLDDETLHARAKLALGITASAPLLAGLAWAFERSGDHEMAELLATEARDRDAGILERAMPALSEWLDAYGGPRARVEVEEEAESEVALLSSGARAQAD